MCTAALYWLQHQRSLYRKLEKVLNRLARNIESHEDMVKAEVCLEIIEALSGAEEDCARSFSNYFAETFEVLWLTHTRTTKPLKSPEEIQG